MEWPQPPAPPAQGRDVQSRAAGVAGGVRVALGSRAWAGVAWRAAPAARSYCSSLGTSTCRAEQTA